MILFTGTSSRPTIWGGCWISNHQPNRCAAYLNLNQLGRISTVFFLLMSVLHTRSPRWNFARHSSPTRGSCSLIDPQGFSSRTSPGYPSFLLACTTNDPHFRFSPSRIRAPCILARLEVQASRFRVDLTNPIPTAKTACFSEASWVLVLSSSHS